LPANKLLGVFLRRVLLCKRAACAVCYVRAPRAEVNTSLNVGEGKANTDDKYLTSAISIILSLLFFKYEAFQ